MDSDELSGPDSRARTIAPALILAGLTLLALGLRFYRIGAWGFESDEVFMLKDSINLRLTNPRPLMYFLNHYLVAPLMPLDEFGIRLLPAIVGVLSIPVFYAVARRLVGVRAALFGAFFLAVSPQYVYYSQFGRYWTLVFLLCSIFPFALYLGARDGDGRLLILGAVTGVLAALAHPVSVLLLGGLGVWAIAEYGNRETLAQLWSRRGFRWGMLGALVVAALIAMRFVPMLRSWIAAHDRVPQAERGGEFLLHGPGGQVIKQITLLLTYTQNLAPAVVLAGLVGIYLLCSGRTRSLGLLLACLFLVPVAFVLMVQIRTAVSIFYLVPATPALFLGVGIFLDRLAGLESGIRPRWLLAAVVAILIFEAGAPTLISQYRDGRRWDFRGAARWLEQRMGPDDVLFSDQPKVVTHYLGGKPVQRLVADPVRLENAMASLKGGPTAALWIVAPAPSHAFRINPRIGALNEWVYSHCQLRNTLGVGRVDFRQNFLQIYRCPPLAPTDGARGDGPAGERGKA